jgi:hypothetical protein
MGFAQHEFVRLRPYLFHLTARTNLVRLGRTRRIHPASLIFAETGRDDLQRLRRKTLLALTLEGEEIVVRDQVPLHPGNISLSDGWTFESFVEDLNRRVFFWPGTTAGPIPYGVRHFDRYKDESPAILRIPTQELFEVNKAAEPRFCRFNSGSPRCSNGLRSPRGANTFVSAGGADFSPGRVVEVTFDTTVVLPESAQVCGSSLSDWETLT